MPRREPLTDSDKRDRPIDRETHSRGFNTQNYDLGLAIAVTKHAFYGNKKKRSDFS